MEQFQVKGRTLVIRMPKELDHHTTGQIPGTADRMIGEKNIQRIEFDFRDTGFMDSSGIGVIMGRYQKLRLLGKISFNPAVELSYLDESQQRDFLEAMADTQNAPSLSQ